MKNLEDYSPKVPRSNSIHRKRSRSSPESLSSSKKLDLEIKDNLPEKFIMSQGLTMESLSALLDVKLASVATKQDIQDLRTDLNIMKRQNEQLRAEVNFLKEVNLKNEMLIEELDNKSRRNNLIFRGVLKHHSNKGNISPAQIVSDFCEEILKVPINADNIFASCLGQRDNADSPVIVSFLRFQDKLNVLMAVKVLKNTGFVIHQDVAAVTRKKRTKLMLIRKEILRINSRLKTSLRLNSLTVEAVKFTWCDTRGICHNNGVGLPKLCELVGADLSDFVSAVAMNTLPKDYFSSFAAVSMQQPSLPAKSSDRL